MPDKKIKITKGTPSHTLGERLKFEVINPVSENEGHYLWNVFRYNDKEKQWKPIRTTNGKSYKFECHFEKESSDGVTFQVRVYKNDKKPEIEENTLLDFIEVTPHKRIEKAPKIISTHFFPEGEYDTNNKVSVYDSLHLRAKTEGLTGKEIQFHVCQEENGKEIVKDTVSARVDHTDYATTKIKLPIDTIKSILTNKNQENQKDYYIKASFGLDKNGKKSTGEITKTYFIDKQGNPIEKISIGDTIRVCIDSKGEIADFLQYTIYEKDKHTSDDVIFQSPKFKLNNNHFFCREIVVTKELFNKGYGVSHVAFDSDYNVQDYYIKVERFSGSANSKTFAVTSDTLKVHYGKSPVKVTVNEKKVEQLPLLKDIFLPALKIETANKISSGKETLHINSEKGTYCILAPQNILEVKQDGRTRQIDVPITSINQNSMHIHFSVSNLGGRKYGYIYPIISTMPNTEKDYRDHQQIEKSIIGKIFVDSKERTTPFGDLVYKIYSTTTHIDFEITIKDNIDKDIYIDFFYCEYNGLTIAVKERLCYKLRLKLKELGTGYYIYLDGRIKCIENNTNIINYFVQIEKGSNNFKKVASLIKNEYGLVEFPASGVGFNRYGINDKGGDSKDEKVGKGDHYLLPSTAAALFGVINEISNKGWEIHFGDMSSENGSDPWQKGGFHHAGHGHKGKRVGLDIDFRYLNTNGTSFQGENTSKNFDKKKNELVFELAYKYGFRKNYATGMSEYTKYGVIPTVGGHYDHGHLGLSNINVEIVSELNIKIIK